MPEPVAYDGLLAVSEIEKLKRTDSDVFNHCAPHQNKDTQRFERLAKLRE